MPLPTVTVAGTITAPDGTPLTNKTVTFKTTAEMVDAAGNVFVPIHAVTGKIVNGQMKAADGTSALTLYASDTGTTTVPYTIRESWSAREFTVNLLTTDVVGGHIVYSTLGPVSPPPTATSPYAYLTDVETRDAATLAAAEAYTDAHSSSGAVSSVYGRTGAVTAQSGDYTKAQVGLGNVDNTSDASKPVSTAQATADALALKIASNLSDLNNPATARTNLGVPAGSGTSTGTNTGDQTLPTTLPPSGSAGGDLTGTYPNPGVGKLNGTSLAGLGTGLVKNTTGTGVPSIAAAADVPTVAAGSTGPLAATDSTTTDARTPKAHAASHASGGSDAVTIAESQVTGLVTDLAAKAPVSTTTIDLVDRTNNTTETVPAGTITNCSTAGVTKTAPALDNPVGTPPKRFSVKNLSAGNITVAYPDQAGAAQSLVVLPAETRTFRQKTTSGWGVESGAIAVATLDARFQPLDADLTGLADPTSAAGTLVSDGSTWLRKTAAQFKTWLGLVAADIPTIAESQVTNLTTDLAAKVPTTRTVAGHALSADVTLAESDITNLTADLATKANAARPTGAIASTFPRWAANNGSSVNGVSGQLKVSLLWLDAGQVVSNLTFVTANTGSTTLTHSVAGLYSSSQTAPALLATSSDVTTATWTANTARTYAMGTPYTVLTSGFFYAAIVLTWTSAGPTFYVQNAGQGTALSALAPITGATCDSGLTTTLPNPAAAPTVNANQMYVYVT